ncbi:hypothetical protein D9M69_698040 [compost metagenome]
MAQRLALETARLEVGRTLGAVRIEHPSGHLDLQVELRHGNPMDISRVSLIRTARKIMDGRLYYRIPDAIH